MPSFPQSAHSQPPQSPRVFWGGPDRPARFLRDLLEEHVHAVPPGGDILWGTYYFRDEGLAAALVQASQRGVQVRVVMEGSPRSGAVNSRVHRILQSDMAFGKGVRALNHRLPDNHFLRTCRLHEKLYYFSHPVPSALVGTFNPSGNQPEDSAVIGKIGDQDRGHNVLVELFDPALVEGLRGHALRLFSGYHGPWERFLPESNRVIVAGQTRIIFFPRSQRRDFDEIFDDLTAGSRLRMAVSHLNDAGICKRLIALARDDVQIEVLAHETQRRVPGWVEKQLLANGIAFNRYVHPDALPMHNKFMLFETPHCRRLTFGSMNLSVRSLHANHELLVIDEAPGLFGAFLQRWQEMLSEKQRQ